MPNNDKEKLEKNKKTLEGIASTALFGTVAGLSAYTTMLTIVSYVKWGSDIGIISYLGGFCTAGLTGLTGSLSLYFATRDRKEK